MGGFVRPPRRPGHRDKYEIMTPERDAFMMDFENSCLEQNWGSRPHPTGTKRRENQEWAQMIQSQVYPRHHDIDWDEYAIWVENSGGDEWFLEAPPERPDDVNEDGIFNDDVFWFDTVMAAHAANRNQETAQDTRCSGCGRDDDFCRCGGGEDNSIWWGR